MFVDLHRHDEFSSFDGFGKAIHLVKIAKEKGLTALGISNHGNVNGLVEHYFGCKQAEIKPIMGCEVYFQPVFGKEKQTYHLCLFIKNLKGYENLNKIMTEANRDNFYYKPIVTFSLLEQYSKGLICSTACVGGFIPQLIINNNKETALKALDKFKSIFGNDFYFEIMPIKVDEVRTQEKVNEVLIKLAKKHNIRCILTSDSHFGKQEDFPTYLKMHQMAGRDIEKIRCTYSDRYMPEASELVHRFNKMHPEYKSMTESFERNMDHLVASVDDVILEHLPLELPEFISGQDSLKLFKKEIIKGLKERGKYNEQYMQRCKMEYDIIAYHGFQDYFLIVQDYVNWAKSNGIAVGPGRGSVCNCLIAFAMGITEVDSIYFNLDFSRFMRYDKKKLPDIDLDFETARRQEVIDYLINKYKNKAVQICSYGLYKADNLLNDLFKVCDVADGSEKGQIKDFVKQYIDDSLNYEGLKDDHRTKKYNKEYDNIIQHFIKLFKQVRFIGTHAAGVAIVGSNITKYTAIQRRKDVYSASYDLSNLEKINAVKFDILGLKTMSELKELEDLTGTKPDYECFEDEKVMQQFSVGETTGIFQYDSRTAKKILSEIEADCMNDVIAATALNRPGPLRLKTPEQYAENKHNHDLIKGSKYYKFTKETYGTIVYQEQIIKICLEIGGFEWAEVDTTLKILKGHGLNEFRVGGLQETETKLRNKFVKNGVKFGLTKTDSDELFTKILGYSFNQGHATGYAIISVYEMYYKVYHQLEFWYVKMKYAGLEVELNRFKIHAAKNGCVIMLPHVNYSADYKITKLDGDKVIVEGLCSIRNVGDKAAMVIEGERKLNGPYKSYDDFVERVPKRSVNSRAVESLLQNGALEFNKKTYLSRVVKYNSTLYMKSLRNK